MAIPKTEIPEMTLIAFVDFLEKNITLGYVER